MPKHQLYFKDPAVDLRLKYRKTLEAAFIVSLLLVTLIFYASQSYDSDQNLALLEEDLTIVVTEMPRTEQLKKPLQPSIPTIPVEGEEDDEALSDEIIHFGEWDANTLANNAPPPQDDEPEIYEFFAVQKKPVLKKQIIPKYPPLARKAGIEGTVVVKVLINKQGNVENAQIYKSIPMLDEAALKAAKKLKYEPAMQRDKCVKVWAYAPFHFRFRTVR